MSVINQMLKDLEQRTPETGQVVTPVSINHKPSTIKVILISLTVLISLNLIGFYIWDLQERLTSSELKNKEQLGSQAVNVERGLSRQVIETKKFDQQESTQEKSLLTEGVSLSASKVNLASELSQLATINEKIKLVESTPEDIVGTQLLKQPKPIKAEPVKEKPIKAKSIAPVLVIAPTQSKMSVSRRQLTSEELVAQKLSNAEKSIKSNDIIKAEQLFEEVLIIDPKHKQTRKKLAALWFGRKSYQQATNLLSQGISLDRNDAELRMLKARVHLQQGQHKAAYSTLKPLSLLKHQEYQLMLANVSQQIEQYKSAIQAYKILIDMQAYSGRWHLGLAIVYDKNSQFSLAVTEYALALTKSDLSVASAEFAQQRMQVLGE